MPYRVPQPIFIIGLNGGSKVFIPEGPREGKGATRWIMADAAVALVACSMCDAKVMEPCRNTESDRAWEAGTHWPRRRAARGMLPRADLRVVSGYEAKEE